MLDANTDEDFPQGRFQVRIGITSAVVLKKDTDRFTSIHVARSADPGGYAPTSTIKHSCIDPRWQEVISIVYMIYYHYL